MESFLIILGFYWFVVGGVLYDDEIGKGEDCI